MKITKETKILIVGLGLLGGSYAMGFKRKGYNVGAITLDEASIEYALGNNIIDYGTTSVEPEIISAADIVVFALYPHIFVEWIKENQQYFKSGAVITDVTGVKGSIVHKIQDNLRGDVEYIAAHPMAGKEVSGIENSDDAIFKNANYIIVPTAKNTPLAIELCREIGEILGFKDISCLSIEQHDKMIAFLSQLTHCIAISLMCANECEGFERYTGDSFRDLTRIARINDEMWSELFLENRKELLLEMENFKESFDKLYNFVLNKDREEMRKMMRISTERRNRFDKKEN